MEVFDDTFIPADFADVWAAGRHCPQCVWPRLRPAGSLTETRLLCDSCGHCWRIEHGKLRPVDPLGCHGCTSRPKRDCVELLQRKFPRFGAELDSDDELQ